MEKNILRNFLKESGGEIMSFLYDMLTKEEMEEIREHDGYVRGHADGVKEGHASGIKEGKAERNRDIAINMLAKGMDVALISELTGLSEKDILRLRRTDTSK